MKINRIIHPFRTRVERGVALLDGHAPLWFMQVDPERLDMKSYAACVLGQTYGGYGNGLDRLGIKHGRQSCHAGFNARLSTPPPVHLYAYRALRKEWTKVVVARQTEYKARVQREREVLDAVRLVLDKKEKISA